MCAMKRKFETNKHLVLIPVLRRRAAVMTAARNFYGRRRDVVLMHAKLYQF